MLQQVIHDHIKVLSAQIMPWASRWLSPEEIAIALDPDRGEPFHLVQAEPILIGDAFFVCFIIRTRLGPREGEGGEPRFAWICAYSVLHWQRAWEAPQVISPPRGRGRR